MAIEKSDVLTIALILSLGLNIYEILNKFPHCDDTDRYSPKELSYGGEEVTSDWAKDRIYAYRSAHERDPSIYKTTGFMMSKKVFDKIFDEKRFNTLSLDLVENENNILTLVVKGTMTDSTLITTGTKSGIFINQSMCPADCSQY